MLPLLLACGQPPDTEPADAPPTAPPATHYSFDLKTQVSDFAEARPEATDGEFKVYASAVASVHMHVIAPGQMCPLHIHRETHEATVIVSGEPLIKHVWGDGDGLAFAESRSEVGDLVLSRPFTGHAWINAGEEHQGNLVIASPPFDGNLYLYANDERMKPGPPPEFIGDSATVSFPTPLARRSFEDGAVVHSDPAFDTLIYVTAGEGRVEDVALREGVVVVLKGASPSTLQVSQELRATVMEIPK